MMNFNDYKKYFESIIEKRDDEQQPPYDNPLYLDFTKSNWKLMNNWLDTVKLSDTLIDTLRKISKPQQWLVITEIWSADSAQNLPFIALAAEVNPLISLSIEFRDSAPHTIEKYLTNGTKSIPKLIIRDENGNDAGTWGARPKECQQLFMELMDEKAPFDKIVSSFENWYSNDKGASIQNELNALLQPTL